MQILYHHRTRAQDAQGIHIQEILKAFRKLGHTTQLVSFADRSSRSESIPKKAPTAGRAVGSALAARLRALPFLYECVEIAYNLWGFWTLSRAIRRRRPDFIYERYSLFNFSGVLVSRLFNLPLVLEVNAPLAYEKEHYEKLFLKRLAYSLERWICSHSTVTIVVSTPMRDILVHEGVPLKHMAVIPNGVNPEEIRERVGRVDVRARYGLGDKLVLGFVGWFKPWHRLDTVLELLASRSDWRGKMHLLLVGDGPEAPRLRELAQALGVEDDVTITGSISREEIFDYINAFDIALQPHVTEYASPMKIFEYLALGKCIVAPDLPNIREILTAGENALFFRPGDAQDMARVIEDLASRPDRVRQMGERAQSVIDERRYYWLENARRALALLGVESAAEEEARIREPVAS